MDLKPGSSMTKAVSPFDPSREAVIIEQIRTRELTKGYKNIYNMDISGQFGALEYIYLCQCPVTGLEFYYPFGLDGDAEFYRQLSRHDWYYHPSRWEHQEVIQMITEGQRLLEIGSGDGAFLEQLLSRKTVTYTGLELNPAAVEKAAARGIRLSREPLGTHAASHAAQYDVVCSFQVMEHISGIGEVIRDSLRVLRPGGQLIIAVPNNDTRFIRHNLHPSRFLNMPPHHVNLFSERSLKGLAGFFSLKLTHVLKEPLQENHTDVFLYNQLGRLLGGSALLTQLAWRSRLPLLFRPLVRRKASRLKGHTIIAVFEKP